MPRYQQTWDVDKVLNHLSSLGDNKNLSLKQLSQKTLTLMALASAGRVSELQTLDLAFIRCDQNEVICTIAGLTKTMKVGNKPQEMKFPKSDGGNLDVYQCIIDYINKTGPLRGDESQFFISFIKPYKKVKTCSLARWLKAPIRGNSSDLYGRGRPYSSKAYHLDWHAAHWSSPKS